MQLTLAIECQADKTLANFCWFGQSTLKRLVETGLNQSAQPYTWFFYFYGANAVGKSHLLQAIVQATKLPAVYLPLKQIAMHGPQIFEGLDGYGWICLDDIQVLAGQPIMEEALFHLYNRVRDQETNHLVCSATTTVKQTPWQLDDLASRLCADLSYELNDLPDELKRDVLQGIAKERGFSLPDNVCDYLFRRFSRNMHDLNKLLDMLGHGSLVEQRKLSIPFVKHCLINLI